MLVTDSGGGEELPVAVVALSVAVAAMCRW